MVSVLFISANFKGAEFFELTAMLRNVNSAALVKEHSSRASANGGFLARTLMCHSFRSQWSLRPHMVPHRVLLSMDNTDSGSHQGY